MSLFVIPHDEPLIKAVKTSKPINQNLGSWQGIPIVAIGEKGGKIIGYGSGGKPIYASSNQAKALAAIQKQDAKDKVNSVGEWLLQLDIPSKIKGGAVYVEPASAKLLEEHFDVVGTKVGGAWKFSFTELIDHIGKPLTPKGDEKQAWAASIAAGEIEDDPFPDLSTLTQIQAGKFAGSHGNKLFVDESGRKWIFKDEDPTIARAEEAASRIGRLIMGEKVPPARHVEIAGKSGVLVGELEGSPLNESNHSDPPGAMLKKHGKDIVKHFVVDWLTSNHDGHAGNFLTDGDKLNGIDKGQAWKFFGKDKLHKDYSPNHSNPIYNKFWNAVKSGLIPMESVLSSLGEAIDEAEKITPQQFESIILPYVTTAAPHVGFNAKTRAKAMVGRLTELRDDMEDFLSSIAKDGIEIPKAGADNFETMPEAEGIGGEKLTIKVPDKPKVIEGGASVPVAVTEVAGWPATKGKVTVQNPGTPSPGGKWPSSYPGPGFKASITYKKQKFVVDFLDVNGVMNVVVTYPNGNMQGFDSPNKASDSMYLYVKDLPLDMTSTEKRKQGISLPAKKAFGLIAFKDELAKAHTGEVPDSAKTSSELEEAKVIEPEQKDLSVEAQLSKLSDGVVEDWGYLPSGVQDYLKATEFEIGADYPHGLPPGVAFKATEEGHPVIYTARQYSDGSVAYVAWEFENGELISSAMTANTIDAAHGLSENATLQALIKELKSELPVTADEKIGASLPAILPETAEVPPEAPKHFKGSMPPGTVLKVKKKGLKGGGYVKLIVTLDDMFKVQMEDEWGNVSTTTWDSLSAASDHVWVNQKGYPNADAYKKATGKNKVPSGGGWKFWGVKPGADPPPPPVGATVPGMASLDSIPDSYALSAYPEGTVIIWMSGGKAYKAKKMGADHWELTGPVEMMLSSYEMSTVKKAENIKIKIGVSTVAEAPEPSEGEWKKVGVSVTMGTLNKDPKGTTYKFWNYATSKTDSMTKVGDNDWMLESTSGHLMDQGAADALKNAKKKMGYVDKMTKPQVVIGAFIPKKPSAPNWETMPDTPKKADLDAMPVGVGVAFSSEASDYLAEKIDSNNWKVMYSGNEELHSSSYVASIIQTISDNEGSATPVDILYPEGKKPAAEPTVPAVPTVNEVPEGELTATDTGVMPIGTVFNVNGKPFAVKVELGWNLAGGSISSKGHDYSNATIAENAGSDNEVEFAYPVDSPAAKKVLKKQKADAAKEKKVKAAKKVGEWLKANPGVSDTKAQLVLAHLQKGFGDYKAWARTGKKGELLLGSPSPDFAEVIDGLEKSGLKTSKVETPLGTFWKVKVDDLAQALPGEPGATVEGPDGKTYPKGTTWEKEVESIPVKQLLTHEQGFYKIKDHKDDPTTKLLKVAGTDESKKEQLLAMAKKHGLTHGKPVKGGSNWLLFVKTAELDATGKEEVTYDAKIPKQPKTFTSAPYPTMGTAKPGMEGVSSPADLSALAGMEIGKFGHSVRMGKAGIFKNGQVYARKVRNAQGVEEYEIYGELARRWDQSNANEKGNLSPKTSMGLPSSMTKDNPDGATFKLHSFEGGIHDESGTNGGDIVQQDGWEGSTTDGARVRIFTEDESFRDNFNVRLPVSGDPEAALAEALTMLGVDSEEAMRTQTEDDERIMKKHAIVKSYIGPDAWIKLGYSLPAQQDSSSWDEKWLDEKLQELGVSEEVIASAHFETTFENHQSVVIEDELIKPKKVKFVYCGNSMEGAFYQALESGHAARAHRNLNGIDQTGASAGADISSGGANGVMMRLGSSKNSGGWGLKCGSETYLAIYHPRVLQRTDWRLYKDDSYGRVNSSSGNALPRMGAETASLTSDGDNEILFDAGISVHDQVGILAPDDYSRLQLIQKFKNSGREEINGIPIEDFVQTRTGKSRAQTAKKFSGLKKGVLP